jgi:hypothetical protein
VIVLVRPSSNSLNIQFGALLSRRTTGQVFAIALVPELVWTGRAREEVSAGALATLWGDDSDS